MLYMLHIASVLT